MKLIQAIAIVSCSFLTQCAVLHKVQIGNIDNSRNQRARKVDIKISETGVNLDEVAGFAKALKRNKQFSKEVEDVLAFIKLFQMGPRTGTPVFVESYARNVNEALLTECPSGNLANIISIRESAKYPVVSGEIVRIIADCYR